MPVQPPFYLYICPSVLPHRFDPLIAHLVSNLHYKMYMHKYMDACPPSSPHVLHPLYIVVHKHMHPCVASVCISQLPILWSHTLIGLCTHISTCMLVHPTLHVCFTPFAYLCANMCTNKWPHICFLVTPLVNNQVKPLIGGDIFN